MDNFIEEQRAVTIQANQETDTVESSLNKKLDGFQSEIDKKLDILQESISKLTNQLVHQEEENPEGWCLTDIMAEEQCEQQPHQELIEDFIELSEGLAESSDMCDVVFPRENQEEIIALLTEEGSGIEAGIKPQKLTLQPIPMKLNPSATAQATYNPLPVYIMATPAANSKSAAPAPKAKSNPSLPAMQKSKKLVANVQAFATTSKHKQLPTLHGTAVGSSAGSDLEHLNLGISKLPPLFVLIFLVLFYFIVFYFDFFNFSL